MCKKDVPPMPSMFIGSPDDFPDHVMERLVKEYGQPVVTDGYFAFRTPNNKGDKDRMSDEIAVQIQVVINDPDILTKPFEEGDMQINTHTENLELIGLLLSTGFQGLITAFHNSVPLGNPVTKMELREDNLDVDITFVLGDKQ